jgi:hypothetical protein
MKLKHKNSVEKILFIENFYRNKLQLAKKFAKKKSGMQNRIVAVQVSDTMKI